MPNQHNAISIDKEPHDPEQFQRNVLKTGVAIATLGLVNIAAGVANNQAPNPGPTPAVGANKLAPTHVAPTAEQPSGFDSEGHARVVAPSGAAMTVTHPDHLPR